MVKFANLDDQVGIIDQLGEDDEPVVLVNVFTVNPDEAEGVLEAWTRDAAFMKRQPGFIWTQLHRGIGESSTFMNYAVWERRCRLQGRVRASRISSQIASYPASTVSRPHLFRKLAVPGICVAG